MTQAATLIKQVAFLAATAAALSTSFAVAKDHPHPNAAPAIALRVYDYSHVDRKVLSAAETEVTGILARAGVDTHWIDCPTTHAAIDNFPACQAPPQPNDYVLSILSGTMAAGLQSSQEIMGSADESDQGTRRAAVFFSRIQSVAGGDAAPTGVLLGRVMAHEIGHMLLGPNAHSRTGIMQSGWSARELGMEAGHDMFFTAQQSRSINARLARSGNASHSSPTRGQ